MFWRVEGGERRGLDRDSILVPQPALRLPQNRRVDYRVEAVYLLVPKVRKGGYVPFFVSERRRSEQALTAVVQEAFINGVSTRKIERLAQAMGIENISASQVSGSTRSLTPRSRTSRLALWPRSTRSSGSTPCIRRSGLREGSSRWP
ncbi:MAG TPA: transposase [Candidatus Bathyarchaeia archaeon]|nr:transposase [Candidatus Bathyarchaeia archaeon]